MNTHACQNGVFDRMQKPNYDVVVGRECEWVVFSDDIIRIRRQR